MDNITKEFLDSMTSGSKAQLIEIRLENIVRSSVGFKGKDVESIATTIETGGCVRALYKGGWGFSSFNKLSDLRQGIYQAVSAAHLAQGKPTLIAPAPIVVERIQPKLKGDVREKTLSSKAKMLKDYTLIALKQSKKIISVSSRYADSYRTSIFYNTDGSFIEQEKQDVSMYIGVMAKSGDDVEQGHLSLGRANEFDFLTEADSEVIKAANNAVSLLSARRAEGGVYTIIADPELTGVFIHEAFGHLSEADHIYNNDKMKKLMALGKVFGSKDLNILDGAAVPNLRGSYKYDDEGVRSTNSYLIKNGVLVGRLHSRETAGALKEGLTGNARAINYRFKPIVRMTNTYIDKGTSDKKQMFKDVERGIYVKGSNGGQTAMENFTFSAEQAFMIENGAIGEPLRGVNVMGNLFETLKNIDAIGKDLKFNQSGGGCGKDGQAPLPVSHGGPHIRIRDAVVGGA